MGDVVKIICPQCEYNRIFHIGTGIQACNPKAVQRSFEKVLIKEFEQLMEQKKIKTFQIQEVLCYCDICKEYRCTQLLHYEADNGISKDIANPCPICAAQLKPAPKKIKCPSCDTELSFEKIGLWD